MDPIDFLRLVHPDGPWGLFAAALDRKGTRYRTFAPTGADAARTWIEARNAEKMNLYWSVGRHDSGRTKKASTEDVLSTEWLHVDIDPRAGEPFVEERERIRRLLLEQCPTLYPTLVLFSGGGFQAFWKLRSPFVFENDNHEEVAQRNKRLSAELGGDSTHDVARVMRLPGTTNWPNAKKKQRGQEPALAEVVCYDDALVYDLDVFERADAPMAQVVRAIVKSERLEDVDNLDKWGVSDRVKIAIVQGRDEDTPIAGDDSDSGWVWLVTCSLLRAGVPEGLVLAILTDKDFGISTHILKSNNPDRYARQQIERAREANAREDEAFVCNKNGKPIPGLALNSRLAIAKMPKVSLAYDEFSGRETCGEKYLDDAGENRLWLACEEEFGFLPPRELFHTVVSDIAREDTRHPVCEYLAGLCWDGTARIDRWLVDYGGAEDTEFVRAVGAIFLVAAVRRVRQPGAKFDEMLVLESPQGWEKSSALAVLAVEEDWFDDSLRLGAKIEQQMESTSGRWIVEAAELEGLRGDNVEKLKSYLSRRIDRARLAYGRRLTERPRQFVVVGTTNSEHYLRDRTGNRRFWPVRVGRFDLEKLRRDRDQLWAEAAVRESEGASIRLPQSLWAVAGEEQAERYQVDPFEELLRDRLGEREGRIASVDVWDLLEVPAAQRTKANGLRVGEAMRALGFVRKKLRYRAGDAPAWGYVRGNANLRIEVVGDIAVSETDDLL